MVIGGFYSSSVPDAIEDKVQIAYLLAPTAANVLVAGRVLTAQWRAIPRALVSVTDSEGRVRTSLTNQFGYFSFDEVDAGETYVFNVRAKEYSFVPQVLNISKNIKDLNFTAQ